MNELQNAIVDDHISDLLREGEALRAERLSHAKDPRTDDDVGQLGNEARHHPVRIRLGRWLIGVGNAVAGTGEGQRDSARRAA
jgi:hypothetical protein